MYTKAFSPTGKTILVAGATSAPTGVAAPELGTNQGYQFRIHNAGSVLAHLGFGASAGEAQTNAVAAVAGTSQFSVPLPSGVVEVLSFPIGSYFSAITATSTASIYITPGKGL